jgi:hypothetical protein
MTFAINDAVIWTSSSTKKEGVIEAVVPAGTHPRGMGYPTVGENASPRPHDSYIVRGGERGKRTSLFWPLVSLLKPAEGLTAIEIDWCNRNAREIRKLIAQSTEQAG